MPKVKEILDGKSRELVLIEQDKSIFEAARILVTNSVGALPVLEQGKLAGIISERDILRLIARRNEQLKSTAVKDVMSTEVIVCTPEDDSDYLMGVMTENKIRHIPILDEGKLVGIISIGDLVKTHLHAAHYEIHYLHDYITGKYPG